MSKKRIIEEVAVGGLSGLVLVVGYIMLRGYLDSASAGDWLQFAGAMLGTGLAVVGALYVEKRRRVHEKLQGKATLMDVLKQMDDSFADAATPLDGALGRDVGEINARRFFLETTKGYAEFALKQHLQPDSRVWRHTSGLINYIDRILAVTWYEHDAQNGEDNCTDATVAHWHKSVTRIVISARSIVERVIAEQEGREPEEAGSRGTSMTAKLRR